MFNPLKTKLADYRIILASTSKQRLELLQQVGFKVEVIPSNFEENLDKSKYTPTDYIQETAYQKVKAVKSTLNNSDKTIILGFDTMALFEGTLFGKPKDKQDAFNTIKQLSQSDKPHLLYTAVCIEHNDQYIKFVENTKVYLRKLTDEQIQGYIDTGEPMGHAASYAIQEIAGSFVEKIEGDYFNVIGVPVCSLIKELEKLVL